MVTRWIAAVLAGLPCPESEDGTHEWVPETAATDDGGTWRLRCLRCGRKSPGLADTGKERGMATAFLIVILTAAAFIAGLVWGWCLKSYVQHADAERLALSDGYVETIL